MKATFADLRSKTREILEALDRNEQVTLYYRGKPRAVMHPVGEDPSVSPRASVGDLPATGMWKDREDMADVNAWVRSIRKGRFDAD